MKLHHETILYINLLRHLLEEEVPKMLRLIIFDMDGVIFKDVNFWMELHKKFGTLKEGKELTKKYLHDNYDKLVEEVVVKLWKGRDAKPYYDLINSIPYMPGAKEVFKYVKKKGYITALISASSIDLARRAQHDLGINHIFANELVIRNGRISGEFIWPVGAGKHKKAQIIRHLCKDLGISEKECVYIGDSETDIEAFQEVGLAIAFNPQSAELEKVADYVVKSKSLADVRRGLPGGIAVLL